MGICVVSSLFRLIFYYNCWNEHGWFLYGFEAPLIRIPNTFSMSTFVQNCINSNCFKQLQIIRSYSHLFDFPSFELMTTSPPGKGLKNGEKFSVTAVAAAVVVVFSVTVVVVVFGVEEETLQCDQIGRFIGLWSIF